MRISTTLLLMLVTSLNLAPATPFYASTYTFQYLRLNADYRKNISFADFKSGHIVYTDAVASAEMKRALDAWYQSAAR
jgi:carboxypeptidase C (cathepsin A)